MGLQVLHLSICISICMYFVCIQIQVALLNELKICVFCLLWICAFLCHVMAKSPSFTGVRASVSGKSMIAVFHMYHTSTPHFLPPVITSLGAAHTRHEQRCLRTRRPDYWNISRVVFDKQLLLNLSWHTTYLYLSYRLCWSSPICKYVA